MESEKAVSSISLNNSEVFLVLEWEKDKKLQLKILNIEEREAYEGEVTEINLRSQAAKIRLSFSDFMLKTRDALFQGSSHRDRTNYLYSLNQTSENYVFMWKSIDSEETIISLGSLEMKKTNFYSFLTQFLFSFVDEMQNMKSSIENLNSELSTCKGQLSTALSNLSGAINLKKDMEKELYSKFILLLNEKKRKIKELDSNKNNSSVPVTKKKKTPPTKKAVFTSESDTESESTLNPSLSLNTKKTNLVTNTVASYESKAMLENTSDPLSLLNKKKKNHLLNMLVSSSESDIDGEFHNDDPGPSHQRLNNSLQFDDETKPVPQTQIRKRKVVPQNSKPNTAAPSNQLPDMDSDDGSVDSLMDLL